MVIKWEWVDEEMLGFTPNKIGIVVSFDGCRGITWIKFAELNPERAHIDARMARVEMELGVGYEAEEQIIKSICEQIVAEYDRFDKEEGR